VTNLMYCDQHQDGPKVLPDSECPLCLKARVAELEAALEEVLNPVPAMERLAKEVGGRLDGAAVVRTLENPETYRDIARKALGR
jgi:hypothetical protein